MAALVQMSDDPEGQKLLSSINFIGIQSAENSDWNDVRGLGIELLADLMR